MGGLEELCYDHQYDALLSRSCQMDVSGLCDEESQFKRQFAFNPQCTSLLTPTASIEHFL
jgi:hypothetical protein